MPVLANALRHAANLATSATSRGLDRVQDSRTRSGARRAGRALWIEAGLVAGVAGLAGAKLLHLLYLSGAFYHPRLRALYYFADAYL